MGIIFRFAKQYVRPLWFRMTLVLLMAAITSSYMFILGFISKITVDHVLQLKPDVTEFIQGETFATRGEESGGLRDNRRFSRDPQAVRPQLELDIGPQKTKLEQLNWLWVIFFSYLFIRMFFSAMNWFYSYNISYIGQRIVFRVRLDLHQKVQKLQMSFFDRHQTGKIMSRILDDVGTLQTEVATTFVETVRNLARIILGAVVLLTINLELAFLTLLAMPLYAITYKLFQKPIAHISLEWREAYAETYGIVEERIRGIRVILSFARERGELRAFFGRAANVFRLSMRRWMWNTSLGAACTIISATATALILYWGTLAVRSGELSVGDLVFFNMSLTYLFMPLIALANINAVLQEMLVIVARVFEVLDEEILIKDRPNAVHLNQVRGRIAFQDVWFRYSENSDYVLRRLDFEVEPGTSVAVVGPSGSGKSTLLSLLMRLYEPSEGTILLDNHDLHDIKLSSLRQHVSMVPQEPVLFSGTIADNIAYGRGVATPEQVMEAAKSAELQNYVMSLPEKYEARVGERGSNLSGGQKQRLAFAMALLTNPSILILDDTTSALDAQTEAKIQNTLDRIMEGRTSFVITHRISTAMKADRILVLDNGRMAGWGRHEELLSRDGVYRQLHEQQQQQGEVDVLDMLDHEDELEPI